MGEGAEAQSQADRIPDARAGIGPLPEGPAGERRKEPEAGLGGGQDRRPRPLLFLDDRLPGGQRARPGPDQAPERKVRPETGPRFHPGPQGRRRIGPDLGPEEKDVLFERESYLVKVRRIFRCFQRRPVRPYRRRLDKKAIARQIYGNALDILGKKSS